MFLERLKSKLRGWWGSLNKGAGPLFSSSTGSFGGAITTTADVIFFILYWMISKSKSEPFLKNLTAEILRYNMEVHIIKSRLICLGR